MSWGKGEGCAGRALTGLTGGNRLLHFSFLLSAFNIKTNLRIRTISHSMIVTLLQVLHEKFVGKTMYEVEEVSKTSVTTKCKKT